MPTLSDIPINLTVDDLMARGFSSPPSPGAGDEIRRALELAQDILVPQFAYEWIEIHGMEKDLILGHVARSQAVCHLKIRTGDLSLRGARRILAGMATAGASLDQQIDSLNRSGQYMPAYLLDQIGLLALNQMTTRIGRLAEREAHTHHWGVSPFLSPGACDGWDLAGQAVLFDLLPSEQIGVHLNAQGMMLPLKTVTGIIAVGPEFGTAKVGPLCRHCERAATCKQQLCSKERGAQ